MIDIIFNYILEITLESKSECIAENNIYHLVIFKNVFASVNFISNQSLCRINILWISSARLSIRFDHELAMNLTLSINFNLYDMLL